MNFSKNITSVLFLVLGLCPSLAGAQEIPIEKGHTEFIAIGKPAMLKIHGQSDGPQGNLILKENKLTGKLTLNLEGLNTGIAMRDEHMKKKYLQVQTYPTAELTLDELPLSTKLGEITKKMVEQKFSALLKLHGVTKTVTGTYDVDPQGKKLKVRATYNLKLSDFNIEIPSYAGLKIADSVDIESSFEIAQQEKTK